MGRVGAKYQEWAFSIGCRNKLPGTPASNQCIKFVPARWASTGRPSRAPFMQALAGSASVFFGGCVPVALAESW